MRARGTDAIAWSIRALVRILAAAVAVSAVACGGSTATSGETLRAPPLPPLPPLLHLVPEGASTIVVARPVELWRTPAARTVLDALLASDLREAFARRTGVDPAELSELVIAEHAQGYIAIARGPYAARDVVRAAESRMSSVEARSDAPIFRRRGFIGSDRYDVAAIAADVVVVASGSLPEMARLLRRVEAGDWPESGASPAMHGADAAALVEAHGAAPLVVYAPRPLELPGGSGVALLLARQRALSAAASRASDEALRIEVLLRGEFPETASENFRALVTSVAASDMGAALGLRDALDSLRIQVDDASVTLSLIIDAGMLARGLRVLFIAEIEEILALPVTGGAEP